MVRFSPDDFLTEYSKFLNKVNAQKTGGVELTFKRYDATNDNDLPPTNDKTGITRPAKSQKTKAKSMARINKGAANPELVKPNSKKDKQATRLTKTTIAPSPDSTTTTTTASTPKQAAVLIRARFGDKKVSCVVPSTEVVDFSDQFATIFRLNNKSLVPQGQESTRMKARKVASQKGKENNQKQSQKK